MTDAARHALYVQLQTLAAGHPTQRVIEALSDSLGSALGFAADDVEHADRLVDQTAVDMKRLIRENWAELCRVRASGATSGSA